MPSKIMKGYQVILFFHPVKRKSERHSKVFWYKTLKKAQQYLEKTLTSSTQKYFAGSIYKLADESIWMEDINHITVNNKAIGVIRTRDRSDNPVFYAKPYGALKYRSFPTYSQARTYIVGYFMGEGCVGKGRSK